MPPLPVPAPNRPLEFDDDQEEEEEEKEEVLTVVVVVEEDIGDVDGGPESALPFAPAYCSCSAARFKALRSFAVNPSAVAAAAAAGATAGAVGFEGAAAVPELP